MQCFGEARPQVMACLSGKKMENIINHEIGEVSLDIFRYQSCLACFHAAFFAVLPTPGKNSPKMLKIAVFKTDFGKRWLWATPWPNSQCNGLSGEKSVLDHGWISWSSQGYTCSILKHMLNFGLCPSDDLQDLTMYISLAVSPDIGSSIKSLSLREMWVETRFGKNPSGVWVCLQNGECPQHLSTGKHDNPIDLRIFPKIFSQTHAVFCEQESITKL